ncbi:MAG TPA: tRNA (N(6)-L-threonylcarbamoyladenosine(37)-C(2))-methylthiotransferase MtaB [Chitinophagaceae bacterium]|nr:tRNA (N(6)-L-threonylcarbamoyladenosine(37)-C(2))-methylthiotransferase MtaB [Chitinophagaceae bacterium]
MERTIAFHTLGCKLNYSETSTLSRQMEQEGFVKKDFDEEADIYLINTCSVTNNADKECRQIVRRIQRRAPEAIVVITGCYAQLKPEEIANIDGVDLVLGAAEKFNLIDHLKDFTKGDSTKICSCDIDDVEGFYASYSANDRTRTFLKVQDGCDYSCTFCTIPLARGHSRSDSIDGVIHNIKALAQTETKEVVLTGINLGDFGKGNEGARRRTETFFDLMKAIEETEGIDRFRISSIEPNLLTLEMIEFVAKSKKFLPHFHIPLQSGSNEILSKMKRRYRREVYEERVAHIKKLMPHACIGVDVIVGFPGETDDHFKETFDFLHELDVAYFHVFTYSERANTPAIGMDGSVPVPVRNERNRVLRNLSYQKMQYFSKAHEGQTRPVLFESIKNGYLEGYTDNYIKVKVAAKEEWENQIVEWEL